MRFEPAFALAEQDVAGWLPTGVVGALAAAIAVVALLARRRLPAGVGVGAFATALSAAVLLLFAADAIGNLGQPALGHVLTALTVFWYALSRIAGRRQSMGPQELPNAEIGKVQSEAGPVWVFAALVCGLAAFVSILARLPGLTLAGWSGATADLVALLLLAVLVRVFHAGLWAVYPLAALLVCLLVRMIPSDGLKAHAGAAGVAMNGLALLALVAVIGAVLRRWWRRRRAWFEDPQRLAEPPFASDALLASLVGLGLLVGLGGLLLREATFTPIAVFLAALTCLIIGHLRPWLVAGELGLILVAEGIVTASMAWLWPSWSGALFGLGLAAIHLLWLARFWDQQLDDGVPWTTTGQLIPSARRLALAATAAVFVVALGAFSTSESRTQPLWLATITVLLLLGAMSFLVRDALEHRLPGGAFAACLMVLAAVVPGSRLLAEATTSPVSPMVLIAAGALLLALRIAVAPRTPPAAAICNAYVGGVLPVMVLLTLARRGLDVQTGAALILTAGAVTVAFKTLRGSGSAAEAGSARGA